MVVKVEECVFGKEEHRKVIAAHRHRTNPHRCV